MESLFSMLRIQAETPKVFTCHFCTTCHNPEFQSGEPVDIEDIANQRSGTVMFKLLANAMKEFSWKEIEATQGKFLIDSDAAIDSKLTPLYFTREDLPEVTIKLLPTRCLSACSFPHVLALNGPKDCFAYQFGNIDQDQLRDIVKMIEMYCSSSDGYSSTRTRPRSLRGHVLARIPPPTGRQVPVMPMT
jgi:predicted metal-binding protein